MAMNLPKSLLVIIALVAIGVGAYFYVFDLKQEDPKPEIKVPYIYSKLSPDLPPEVRQAWEEKVYRLAKPGDTISFGDLNNDLCAPDPVILELTSSPELTLTNRDDVPHAITFSTKEGVVQYAVGPNSTETVEAPFIDGRGIYSYRCDDKGFLSHIVIK